ENSHCAFVNRPDLFRQGGCFKGVIRLKFQDGANAYFHPSHRFTVKAAATAYPGVDLLSESANGFTARYLITPGKLNSHFIIAAEELQTGSHKTVFVTELAVGYNILRPAI